MKRLVLRMQLLFALIMPSCAFSAIVVDWQSKEPVASAVVFSANGSILDHTDINGKCKDIAHRDFPVTIKCLGYKQKVCVAKCDTVYMEQDFHELGEVIVTPAHRPIMNVLCYIREYTSGGTTSDTVQYFAEHMAMFYIPQEKVKGFKARNTPHVVSSIMYQRKISANNDIVFMPEYRPDDISWIDIVSYPEQNVAETPGVKQGAKTDTVMGKHHRKVIARKTDNYYIESTDILADKKDHKMSPFIFKMLGMTIDFNDLTVTRAYKTNDKGEYKPEEMLFSTFSMEVLGKGKWIKKAFNSKDPVLMKGLFEIYPIKIDFLTVEEANSMLNGKLPKVVFQRSELASPLPSGIQSIINRAKSQ